MPIYVYQIVTPQGDGAIFEMLQPLHAPALTRKPDTGEPVRRVITAPNLPLRHGGSSLKKSPLLVKSRTPRLHAL